MRKNLSSKWVRLGLRAEGKNEGAEARRVFLSWAKPPSGLHVGLWAIIALCLCRGRWSRVVPISSGKEVVYSSSILTLVLVVKASFSCSYKIVKIKSLHILNIKHRLITKLITELVCKLRD